LLVVHPTKHQQLLFQQRHLFFDQRGSKQYLATMALVLSSLQQQQQKLDFGVKSETVNMINVFLKMWDGKVNTSQILLDLLPEYTIQLFPLCLPLNTHRPCVASLTLTRLPQPVSWILWNKKLRSIIQGPAPMIISLKLVASLSLITLLLPTIVL
jgi:hypothetical protein